MKSLRKAPLAAAMAAALFGIVSGNTVLAQDRAADTAKPAVKPDAKSAADADKKKKTPEKAAQLESVIVTGSRIPRAGFDTLEPATVITRDYLDVRGLTNIADALNEIPGFGVGTTPEGGQSSFGVGVNFVNRFGLGSQRTLTVVNGRRFVSANAPTIFGPANPGVQVDLNTIPTQIIERVENVAIGGAPTYGSDAVAGTVNIILKKDYEGAEARVSYGITERGDNQRYNASAIWGRNFQDNRANFTIAVARDNADGVLAIERDRFANAFSTSTNPTLTQASTQIGRTPANDGRVNIGIPFNGTSSDGIPNSVLIINSRIYSLTWGGLALPTGATNLANGRLRCFAATTTTSGTCLQFATGGNLVPYNPGTPFGTQNASGGDGIRLNDTAQLTSDLGRTNVTALGSYDITDDVEAFFELIHYRAKATELVDQPIFNSTLFGGLSAPITFGINYPLLNQQARTTLASLGVSTFRVSRASRDLVENNAWSESSTTNAVLGVRGAFEFGQRFFDWEVSGTHGTADSDFFQTVLNQQHFINALHVTTNGSGQVVCSPTAIASTLLVIPGGGAPVADPNCVPLNLFGEGTASAAARAYVTDQTHARSKLEQTIFNANVGGTLFDMWGGGFAVNAGFERRIEKGEFLPDAFQQAGRGRAVRILPNAGGFDTKEWFGEFVAPFVKSELDLPLLKRFDVTGKFRQVDNSVNGKFNAYTYGFQWSPFAGVTVRANKTRSLRAPAITELFTPISSAFNFFPDPCDATQVTGGTNPAVRQANCAAFYAAYGLDPATFQSTARTASIPITTGGNPNLLNEKADSWTTGIVFEPSWMPGFRMSVDYYNIKIDNQIANLNSASIATGCYDNPDFNTADVNNANQFCSLFRRAANGQVLTVQEGYVNGAYIDFTGASVEILYRKDIFNGRMDVAVSGFRPMSLNSSTNNIVNSNSIGLNGQSDFQYQGSVAYNTDLWGASLQGNYTSGPHLANPQNADLADILTFDDYWLFNLGGYYNLSEKLTFRAAVSNLFDREPPFPFVGTGVYDILGRRYNVSVQYTF